MRVSVTVKRSNGEKFVVEAELDGTVLAFKEELEQTTQVTPALQRLIYKGKVLKDELTLASYELEANQTIYFVKGAAAKTAPAAPTTPAAAPAPAAATPTPAPAANPFGASPFGASPFGASPSPFGGMSGMGDMPGMQQMLQNPEMMQQMMESPMMQSLMNNPEVMRNMMQANPAMRQLLEQNPELNHVMNDPEMLRRSMEAMRNPAAMREMMRSQDTALRNIESHPEGFNALRRMYTEVQEPLMNAASSGASMQGSAFPMPGAVGGTTPTPPAATTASTTPANPWGTPSTTTVPATGMSPFGANPWGASPFGAGANPLGTGGFDPAMLNDPMVRGMMEQLSNNPEMMRSMMEMNPQLQALDPAVREQLLNPETLRTMMNPANLQAIMQMQAAMQQLQGTGMLGNLGAPPAGADAAANPFGAPNPFLNNPFSGGFGAPAAPAGNPEELYASQLTQLVDMGFTNRDQNLRALQATFGNVNAAVDRILSGLS